tara:strand:- start:57 stop:1058 length:1002 start_codon:yes stop_codon:yes gene_type:complete
MQENYLLKKSTVPELLGSLGKQTEVFVPCVNENNATDFLPYTGQELFLDSQTYYSPKKILSPPLEKEFAFRKKSSSFKISHFLDRGSKIIFGVRPCDTHAIDRFDKLYLEYFTEDPFYKSLRENTLVIALQCRSSCENGFCQSMGTDKPVGHDILLIEKEKSFFVEVVSEKGKKFVEEHRDFFNRTKFVKPEVKFECNKKLNTKGLKEILDNNFFHEKWKQEGEKCLSCTSCTQVCPSCYCFLTFDKFILNTENSERFREWDSCQLQRFTKVSGNHVFRQSRESRLRQFVMHKLSYFQENHDAPLCIGCGRCISVCPVNIDLTEIAKTIRGSQ